MGILSTSANILILGAKNILNMGLTAPSLLVVSGFSANMANHRTGDMQHAKLLNDATGATPEWSERSKYHALSVILTDAGTPAAPKAIENWFVRQSIPTKWLYLIRDAADLKGRPIDLNSYA